jgi:hypothetical protein
MFRAPEYYRLPHTQQQKVRVDKRFGRSDSVVVDGHLQMHPHFLTELGKHKEASC